MSYLQPVSKANLKLVKLLELLVQYDKPGIELEQYNIWKPFKGFKSINISRDYSIVAKKCLISHRLNSAAMMLDIICQEMNMDDPFFYKASSIVLENAPSTTNDDFFYFIRHAVSLKCINKREVALEYLIHALRNKNIDGQHNAKILIASQRKGILKHAIIDPLMKAYTGMFDYLEWAKCNERGVQDLYATTSAEKAIDIFREILDVPGQWDIFVLKLIEMLQILDRSEQIESLLKKYVTINPEHLNSYIYLCWYLNKYNPSSEELRKNLTTIAECCPSDPRILLLVKLLKDNDVEKALGHLFMFLDYPSNSGNVEAWEMLLDLLIHILEHQMPSLLNAINTSWKNRCDIWPHIHFNAKHCIISNENEATLAITKGTVLSVFVKSHSYIGYILNILLSYNEELCKEFVNKVFYIQYLKESSSSEDSDDNNSRDMDVT